MSGIWKNLCLQFVHDFCGFEKMDEESKEVFSNSVTLSEKLGLDPQEENVTEARRFMIQEMAREFSLS